MLFTVRNRRTTWLAVEVAGFCVLLWLGVRAQDRVLDITAGTVVKDLSQVLGRPTDRSITLNLLAPTDVESYVEFSTRSGSYSDKTAVARSTAREPLDVLIDGLKPNTQYYYRLRYRQPGEASFATGPDYQFHTQRPPGSRFVFDVQSDSHPERINRMFHSELYARTMQNVQQDKPDFYITMGDDFSVDEMALPITPTKVAQVYIDQRLYLGMSGSSAPIFLVNGNHEQAAKYLLDGTPNNNAVWAGNARNRYYPQPAPDRFYTGDEERVEHIGLLHDYYAWTWGDALFVTLDPYWHSNVVVDNPISQGNNGPIKEGPRTRDMWDITLGEAQYRWLRNTLSQSTAKCKFIFTHHVLGTGRGGVEMATLYEWGGKNDKGVWEFDKKRPGWELPIHQLMSKYGVTIFFHGHDHVFVRQELDGVVYQETPNPANPNYGDAFREVYRYGDFLPASGHLRVTVAPENVKVDYIRSWMAKDVTAQRKQGEIAFSYSAVSRARTR